MSIACAKLVAGDSIHCEPAGSLKQYGWLPGTWVKYIKATRTFTKGAVTSCERCGNTDYGCGFIPAGSQSLNNGFDFTYPNDNEPSGTWTMDVGASWMARMPNAEISFDSNNQVSKLGSGIVSVSITNTGVYKFYVFEKYNKEYRDTDGIAGTTLNWDVVVGLYPSMYISDRGLLTCEKESVNSDVVEYILADTGIDEVGKFVLIASS